MKKTSYGGCRENGGRALPSTPPLRGRRSGIRAFSLVEVTLATGMITFSFLVMLGLMPVGLTALNDSGKQMAQTTIFNTIETELAQTGWTNLTSYVGRFPKYFDLQGNEVASSGDSIYTVRLSVGQPARSSGSAMPASGTNVETAVVSIGYQVDPRDTTRNVSQTSFLLFNRNAY